jgi:hypothetical protein
MGSACRHLHEKRPVSHCHFLPMYNGIESSYERRILAYSKNESESNGGAN